MIHQWKRALLESASAVFERGSRKAPEVDEEQVKDLHAKIGELAVANYFFGHKAQTVDRQVRRKMIEPSLPGLSVGKQCALLSISRSSFYSEPKGETELNLDLMRLIDRPFLETPFYGVRQMTRHLRNEGHPMNDKRIRRLMRLMPAVVATCFNPDMKAKYEQLVSTGKCKKLAITAVMRKLIVMANALLRDQRKWGQYPD
jgi:putative transposase